MSVLQGAQWDVHVLAQLLSGLVELHDTAAGVVLAVPNDLIGSSLVQDQSERRLGLPHLTSHIVSAAELIAEALTIGIDHQATHSTESLSSQELDLGLGIIGLDQTCRMDLYPLQVNATGTNGLTHLDAITSGVVTIGGGQMQQVGAVLGQQGIIGEVGAKATGGQNHWSLLGEILALLLVDHATDAIIFGQELLHLGLVDDSGQVTSLGDLLHHLDQGIGDGHSGETLLAAVGAGSGMTTQAGQEGHVKIELVHQPVHIRAAVSTEHLAQASWHHPSRCRR
eukprot:Skav203573  [mRNA]  locus=scaffold3576:299476:300856:- [translate_table: standard]